MTGVISIQDQTGHWHPVTHVPERWTGDLCNTWGATSLHAEVFRKPCGFRWVHCARCRLDAPPSSQLQYCPFVPAITTIAERIEALVTNGGTRPSLGALTLKRMTEIIGREFARASLP